MAKKPEIKAKPKRGLKEKPKPKIVAKAQPKSKVRKRKKAIPPVRTVRTARARATFLTILEETCNVSEAARAAGMGRRSAYDWREDDADFAAAWDDAIEAAADKLEQVAFERAKAGTSDRMLEILLKAHRPQFREKQRLEHSGPDGGPIEYQRLSDEEVEARIRAHEAAVKGDG